MTTIDQIQQPRTPVTQTTAVEQARAVAEVAAAVRVAQDNPRNRDRALGEMRDSCGRLALANRAFYSVPNRGNGPSVHLARELARIWGNVRYGVHELSRNDETGMSEIRAFAVDLETNVESTRTFQVPHERMVKKQRSKLTDLGDVYLNNQNIGARAVRECIFTVLPTWFTEEAQDRCNQTLRDGEGVPLDDRITQMVDGFRGAFGVTEQQLEDRLGRKRGQWDAGTVAQATVIYTSLQRGETKVADEFPPQSNGVTAGEITGTESAGE
ncbi:hypothetical protein [Pimelobacter simplex]|uniref:hypothetical protein n=1 Tax=Nocardioides simplex TaxID=2045 RepID=UPI003AB104C1